MQYAVYTETDYIYHNKIDLPDIAHSSRVQISLMKRISPGRIGGQGGRDGNMVGLLISPFKKAKFQESQQSNYLP